MSTPCPPIVLFCDFGLPYTGQMKARLVEQAPDHPVIDLFHDAPAHDIRAGAFLLAAHAQDFPSGSVFVCVVDPGVGSTARAPGVVHAGGRWFVGPLNGLFEYVLRRWPKDARAWEITWRPEVLSNSFHGRDLFAPTAARIARGDMGGLEERPLDAVRHMDFDDELAQVIYVDGFGNLMTGIRAADLCDDETLEVAGRRLARLRTFADAKQGEVFCYENAVGLMEIAANRASAEKTLEIDPGAPIRRNIRV